MAAAILPCMPPLRPHGVALRYPVGVRLEDWLMPEDTVPESVVHNEAALHLDLLLRAWIVRTGRAARVARNLAIRFLEAHPRVGIDPDVCLVEPVPEDFQTAGSLRLWQPGHQPPPLCIEVVSTHHPNKDYTTIQDRYAALGAGEVVIFDPTLAGPRALGGPVHLQLWRRDPVGVLDRVAFGNDPVYSEVLDAWLVPQGPLVEIAHDRQAERPWLTGEAHERAEKERERAEKEHERAEKERERAEKERERAEKERERAARLDLEERLAELEARLIRH